MRLLINPCVCGYLDACGWQDTERSTSTCKRWHCWNTHLFHQDTVCPEIKDVRGETNHYRAQIDFDSQLSGPRHVEITGGRVKKSNIIGGDVWRKTLWETLSTRQDKPQVKQRLNMQTCNQPAYKKLQSPHTNKTRQDICEVNYKHNLRSNRIKLAEQLKLYYKHTKVPKLDRGRDFELCTIVTHPVVTQLHS